MLKDRIRLLAVLGGLVLVSALGYEFGQGYFAAHFKNGGLEVDPAYLDFGEAWEQKAYRWTLPIHNASSRNITIDRWITTCGCVEVSPSSPLIPARQTVEVNLAFDLTAGMAELSEATRRPFSTTIVPAVKEGLPHDAGWTIKGMVRQALALSSRVLSFDESLVSGERFEPQAVEVSGAESPLADLAVKTTQPAYATVDLAQTHRPNRYRVTVRPNETLAVGRHLFDIILTGVSTGGESLPPVTLPVVMNVVDDIRLSPTCLVFGALPLGKSAEGTVLVESRTGKPRRFVAAEAPGQAGIAVKQLPETPDRIALRVRQEAKASGAQEHYVSLLLQTGSANVTHTVRLPVSYFGVAGEQLDQP